MIHNHNKLILSISVSYKLISLTLFGTIATDFGGRNLSLELLSGSTTLKDILFILKNRFSNHFSNYFDEDFSPKRGTLILINGADFNTLDGLNTILSIGDQISFIPTISGG